MGDFPQAGVGCEAVRAGFAEQFYCRLITDLRTEREFLLKTASKGIGKT